MARVTLDKIVTERSFETRENIETLKNQHNETDDQVSSLSTAIDELPNDVDIYTVFKPTLDNVTELTDVTVVNGTFTTFEPTGDFTITVQDGGDMDVTGDLTTGAVSGTDAVSGDLNVTIQSGGTLTHEDQVDGTYSGDINVASGGTVTGASLQSGSTLTVEATTGTTATTVTIGTLNASIADAVGDVTTATTLNATADGAVEVTGGTNSISTSVSGGISVPGVTGTTITITADVDGAIDEVSGDVDTIDYSSAPAAKIITESELDAFDFTTLTTGQFLLVRP